MEKSTNTVDELVQFVSFKLGKEEFCVNIFSVKEINKMLKLTQIPNSPEFVEGVVNLRGVIIPVINLRSKLNMPSIEDTQSTRIVVIDIKNQQVGLKVDEVSEVLRIQNSLLENPPELANGVNSKYIKSVAKLDDRLLMLLDVNLITEKDIEQLKLN